MPLLSLCPCPFLYPFLFPCPALYHWQLHPDQVMEQHNIVLKLSGQQIIYIYIFEPNGRSRKLPLAKTFQLPFLQGLFSSSSSKPFCLDFLDAGKIMLWMRARSCIVSLCTAVATFHQIPSFADLVKDHWLIKLSSSCLSRSPRLNSNNRW